MDRWSDGDSYERYVGRWSRPVARRFVDWLDVPAGRRWLDVGCGTGALTETVLDRAAPAAVLAVDPSSAFVRHAAARLSGADVRQADAASLPAPDASVDAVVSGLVLNFVPDRAVALAELRRVTRPGGVVAAYVWDYADGMEMMRHFWDAAAELDPAAGPLHERARFPVCRPGPLRALLTTAGLAHVEVEAIEVPTTFRDFDDYWSPFLAGQGPAPSYVSSLDPEGRSALREALSERLPRSADGSIQLTARAWAVRGTR